MSTWITGSWSSDQRAGQTTLLWHPRVIDGRMAWCYWFRQAHIKCKWLHIVWHILSTGARRLWIRSKTVERHFFLNFSSSWSWKELLRNYFSVPPVIVLIALWYSFLLIFHPHSLIFHNNGAKPFCYRSIIFWSVQKSHKSAGRVWASVRRLIEESVKTWSHGASTAPLLTTVPPLTPPLVLLRAPAMGNVSQ